MAGQRREWGMPANRLGVSFRDDENVLKLDGADGFRTL
jgi:hypothetical protein